MPIDNKTLLRVRSIVGAGGGGEGGEAVIRSLSVTKNGTYTAPSGVDGYSPVTVNVPEPTGTKTITANGTHDVTAYASAQVNVPDTPAVTEALTVTENGTYTPDSGVDGFDSVTVNVAGSGGGEDYLAMRLTNTLTEYSNDSITSLNNYGFYMCTKLTKVSFPNVTTAGLNVFAQCPSLADVNMPKLAKAGQYMFQGAVLNGEVNLPAVTVADNYSFISSKITDLSFLPNLKTVKAYAFSRCSSLAIKEMRKA